MVIVTGCALSLDPSHAAGVAPLDSLSESQSAAMHAATRTGSFDAFDGVESELTGCAGMPKTQHSDLASLGPIYLPANNTAADAIEQSWTCGTGTTPFVVLESHPGIVISCEGGWGEVDVEKKWAGFAENRSSRAEVVGVSGLPALLDPAVTDDGFSQVLIVVGDHLVRVTGDSDVDTAALLEVARSLDLSRPATAIT